MAGGTPAVLSLAKFIRPPILAAILAVEK
jgi:hypothetical protein